MNSLPTSLYIHIPFCQSKCFYCDFNSFVANDKAKAEYTEALLQELAILHSVYFEKGGRPRLDTLFFGGGTPTALPLADWEKIARFLHSHFHIDAATEWTVEANPGTASDELLAALYSYGVNRLSFGVQTLDGALLAAIGRSHKGRDVAQSLENARRAGFARVSVDLMYGLPGQTLADVQSSLSQVAQFGVGHVSMYGLKIEENTPFSKWQQSGRLHLPDEDTEAQMYEEARRFLQGRGISQYEISNFARPGEEARHNLTYWRNQPYLAAGAGAHGYVSGVRYENLKAAAAYQKRLAEGVRPVAETRAVTPREAMEDSVVLGLRLREGVSKARFFQQHQTALEQVFGAKIAALVKRGWLLENSEGIRIPAAYFPVANEIMLRFLGDS